MKYLTQFITAILLLTSSASFAEEGGQFQQSGRYQIHYMALSTTFITPEISKNYSIKRSRYNAFVNISEALKADIVFKLSIVSFANCPYPLMKY